MKPVAAPVGETRQCDPRWCGLANHYHEHCICGLPMRSEATVCSLCKLEGIDPVPIGAAPPLDGLAWDGFSYPSRRRHRRHLALPEPYEHLLEAVLGSGARDTIRLPRSVRWLSTQHVPPAPLPEAFTIARRLAGRQSEGLLTVATPPSLPTGEDCGAAHTKEPRRRSPETGHSSLGMRGPSSPLGTPYNGTTR
jgi:hypothetical protein